MSGARQAIRVQPRKGSDHVGVLAEGESYTVLEAVTDDLGTRRVLIRSAGGTEGWIRREHGPEPEPGEPALEPRESVAKWLARLRGGESEHLADGVCAAMCVGVRVGMQAGTCRVGGWTRTSTADILWL